MKKNTTSRKPAAIPLSKKIRAKIARFRAVEKQQNKLYQTITRETNAFILTHAASPKKKLPKKIRDKIARYRVVEKQQGKLYQTIKREIDAFVKTHRRT